LICIPTYNEADNIAEFLTAVFESSPPGAHVLVVDDNSPDNTALVAEGLIPSFSGKLHLLKRPGKEGLGRAYLAAFRWGLERDYRIFLEMDADFSHHPRYIVPMLAEIENCDAVLGSRNVEGGGVEGWPFFRRCVSKGGSLYSRIVLGCPVRDLTGGFNMWTREALQKIGLENITASGFLFQVEMKYLAWKKGLRIREVPIIFTDRRHGKSKMSRGIFFEALIKVWGIKLGIDPGAAARQFVKFAVTGGLGTVTNLLVFFIAADRFSLPEIPVGFACFLIAGTQNYVINHLWSFADHTGGGRLRAKKWLLFLCSALAGLAVNMTVMKLLIMHLNLPYKFIAQACGIAAGMAVNFVAAKKFVFKENRHEPVKNQDIHS
jgi:dolichol-phosphate mannosyltransferase